VTAGAFTDCHLHVIDPARFPFADGPGYRPVPHETGTREQADAIFAANGIGRAVFVQASGYAFDNSAILDAVARAPERFRAIAVIEGSEPDAALERLAERGVVGARFNLASFDGRALSGSGAARLLDRIHSFGWFVQVHATDAQWAEVTPLLLESNATVLVDHFGIGGQGVAIDALGFRSVLDLGRSGRAIVKLSSPFRIADPADGYAAIAPHVEALLDVFDRDRRLWGSDWPFLALSPGLVDYAASLASLARWLPDAADRQAVLVDNPTRLFGFGEVAR
jgi:predicted TIM-barrel fold metal-dependent hydrolase